MNPPTLTDLDGADLGSHTASFDDADVILYALAVGASATDLDLVHERQLRTLPTYACALGLWAVEAAGRLGAYDPTMSLHAAQRLDVRGNLPASGEVPMTGRIANVFDKGKAALVEIEVSAAEFDASYGIFLPGLGGWGGDRGPSTAPDTRERTTPPVATSVTTRPELAALYRLTGDRHPVHIDPAVAEANGFARPILHGLCTIGIAARVVAGHVGSHPADLRELAVRLAGPVTPGDTIDIESSAAGTGPVRFDARVGGGPVLRDGTARFRT